MRWIFEKKEYFGGSWLKGWDIFWENCLGGLKILVENKFAKGKIVRVD